MTLHPLRFEPIFKRPVGRPPPARVPQPHPAARRPIGEAWVLSDVDGSPSRVADGPLEGATLRELLAADPQRIVGRARGPAGPFPAPAEVPRRPAGTLGAGSPQRRAGGAARAGPVRQDRGVGDPRRLPRHEPHLRRLRRGRHRRRLPGRAARRRRRRARCTASHRGRGDCVFLEAGTVHAIGANILLFEVQQTSDITYRLYDWDRVDAKTGQAAATARRGGAGVCRLRPRPVPAGAARGEEVEGVRREGLVACRVLHAGAADEPGAVPGRGANGECRAVVCVGGSGEIEWRGQALPACDRRHGAAAGRGGRGGVPRRTAKWWCWSAACPGRWAAGILP